MGSKFKENVAYIVREVADHQESYDISDLPHEQAGTAAVQENAVKTSPPPFADFGSPRHSEISALENTSVAQEFPRRQRRNALCTRSDQSPIEKLHKPFNFDNRTESTLASPSCLSESSSSDWSDTEDPVMSLADFPMNEASWCGSPPREMNDSSSSTSLRPLDGESELHETEYDSEFERWLEGRPAKTPQFSSEKTQGASSNGPSPRTKNSSTSDLAVECEIPAENTCRLANRTLKVPHSPDQEVDVSCANGTAGIMSDCKPFSAGGKATLVGVFAEPEQNEPRGPRQRVRLLATQGSCLLHLVNEDLDHLMQTIAKCEQYFGATDGAKGGGDGAVLFSTVSDFITAFSRVWDEVHRDDRYAQTLPGHVSRRDPRPKQAYRRSSTWR